ncbi:MAG: hypothetical protein MJZ32_10680 [Bacteroidaceae bacterium]|nr:hypothetical protein [Bacteroidaceae bacterium]
MEDKSLFNNTNDTERIEYINECVREVCINGDDLKKYEKMIGKLFPGEPELFQNLMVFVKNWNGIKSRETMTETSIANIRYIAQNIHVSEETIEALLKEKTVATRPQESLWKRLFPSKIGRIAMYIALFYTIVGAFIYEIQNQQFYFGELTDSDAWYGRFLTVLSVPFDDVLREDLWVWFFSGQFGYRGIVDIFNEIVSASIIILIFSLIMTDAKFDHLKNIKSPKWLSLSLEFIRIGRKLRVIMFVVFVLMAICLLGVMYWYHDMTIYEAFPFFGLYHLLLLAIGFSILTVSFLKLFRCNISLLYRFYALVIIGVLLALIGTRFYYLHWCYYL